MPGRREPLHAQPLLAARRLGVRREIFPQLAPDHQPHQRRLGQLGGRLRGHVLAVAQHGDRIAEREDLRHAVRHEELRHPLRLERGNQRVEPLRLGVPQAAGRLVEDDHPRPLSHRRGDLHHLLLGHAQRAHVAIGVDRRAGSCKELPRPRPHRVAVHETVAMREAPQAEVVAHGEVVAEGELLVHHRHPRVERVARRREVHRLPVQLHVPLVGLMQPGDDAPQRALAGAVLPADRVARAGGDVERDVAQRHHAGKALGDVADAEARDGHLLLECEVLRVHVGEAPLFQLAGPLRRGCPSTPAPAPSAPWAARPS